MEVFTGIIDFVLHIDIHLGEIILRYGVLSYAIIFIIIFAETGFVFTPFLPGDSLLFAAGAFAAIGSFRLSLLLLLLFLAAVLGDTANYWIGRYFGQKIIDHPKFPLNQSHVDKTQKFYDRHGGKTIFLARFIPIIRTFAPFVAGLGRMNYRKFIAYNLAGGFVWVFAFTFLGYFFGNIPSVKDNFSLVILGIIVVSVLPMTIELFRSRAGQTRPPA
jgi:membrane-associated protein